MSRKKKILLALGANLGDREEQIAVACSKLSEYIDVLQQSSMFFSPAMGFKGPDFVNNVLLAETCLLPHPLLKIIKEIEADMGKQHRERDAAYNSRPIDIDVVFYESEMIATEELQVPHPEMHKRDFVLVPASEVAPDWRHPILKKSVTQLKNELDVHSS